MFDCQNKLCEAFVMLLDRNHSDVGTAVMFGRCLALLRLSRDMTMEHHELEEKIILDWEDKVQFPPIFYELMS